MDIQVLLRGVKGIVRWPECHDFLHKLIMKYIFNVAYFEGKWWIYGNHI